MTTKLISILLLLVLPLSAIRAQKIDLQVRTYPSSWYNGWYEPALDGGGLMIGYHPRLTDKLALNVNGEFAILRARNEVILGLGLRRSVWQSGRWSLSGEANLLNGLGLYRPNPLWVGGGEILVRGGVRIGKTAFLFLSAGVRYTICPGYRVHGPWRHNAWPVGIGIAF